MSDITIQEQDVKEQGGCCGGHGRKHAQSAVLPDDVAAERELPQANAGSGCCGGNGGCGCH